MPISEIVLQSFNREKFHHQCTLYSFVFFDSVLCLNILYPVCFYFRLGFVRMIVVVTHPLPFWFGFVVIFSSGFVSNIYTTQYYILRFINTDHPGHDPTSHHGVGSVYVGTNGTRFTTE